MTFHSERCHLDLLQSAIVRSAWLRQFVDDRTSFRFDGSRHRVCLASGPTLSAYLKLSGHGKSVAHEAHATALARALLAIEQPLAAIVPKICHADRAVLATEPIADVYARPTFRGAVSSASKLGAALAVIHAATPPFACGASLPVYLVQDPLHVRATSNGPQRMLLDEVSRKPAIDAFREVAESWRSDAFIHGDLRASNVLGIGHEGTPTILDWELAGNGDRRWDLACVFAELLLLSADVADADEMAPSERAEVILGALLAQYESRTGITVPGLDRLPAFAAAWLLQQAWEELSLAGRTHRESTRFSLGIALAGSRLH